MGSPGRGRPGEQAQVGPRAPINGSLPSLLLPKGEAARAPLTLETQVGRLEGPSVGGCSL